MEGGKREYRADSTMSAYTLYHSDGRFAGYLECDESQLAGNIQPGFSAVPGRIEQDQQSPGDALADLMDRNARIELANLERLQARRVRELLMQDDSRLQEIDSKIREQRLKLKPQ
jgi:hypothetical protein